MQRKSLAIATTLCSVAALAGTLLLLPGCCGTPATQVASSSEQAKYHNVTLTVACPNETAEKLVTEYGQGWTHKTGARVQVVRYPANEAVLPQADVVLLSPAELPAFAPELAIVPTSIQDSEGSSRWNDVVPMYRTRLLKWDEKTYAVPVLGDAVVCFYRRDLFDDPNHQAEFKKKFRRPLQAPATWEDVLEIAEYFHDNQADPRPVKHALPPIPASPVQLDHLFYSVAAPYTRRGESAEGDQDPDRFSFQFDIKTGESRIARPGFVHALGQLQKMQQYRPSAPDANPWHEFAKGVGVVYVGPVHELLLFQQHPDSKVRDLIGICPVPGTREYFPYNAPMPVPAENGLNVVPYRGARGLLGTVPARSGHTEAAWSFLAELSSPNLSRQIVSDPRWGGCPFRLTHVREERWDGFKLRPEQTDQLRKTLNEPSWRDPKNPVVQLRIPHAPLYQKDLLVEVNRCLFEKKSPAAALEAVDTAWRKRAQERGKDHGVDYQLNWGLRPTRE